jgi:pimeloyl-ACP methyl ester carboxylesterase
MSATRLRVRILILALALGALAWSLFGSRTTASVGPLSSAAPDVLQVGRVRFEPCDIGRTNAGVPTLRAYCAAVPVPENYANPGGRVLQLKVAVLRSDAATPAADLVTFLDGGPGGAATEDFPALAGAFAPLRKRHAVLLIDQRGTGGSGPLECGKADTTETQPDLVRLRECVQRLSIHADLSHYATTDAVEDLETVRRALGSPLLDLIGLSYGTRLAQQYALRHGDGVRTLVLDGPVPNSLVLGSEHAANLERVLRDLFDRCRATRSCADRYGDPYQTLRRVQARLRATPQKVSVRDPYTFGIREETITAGSLAGLVRLYAYNPYTAALLPFVLQQADEGDYAPLMGQSELVVGDVSDSLAGGMALSVICAEDADRLQVQPADADSVLGNALVQSLLAACPFWPHGTRPADFGAPLTGPWPVLVLAGEHDPVTPPRYGQAIVRTLPNGRMLVVRGQGHGVLNVGCVPRLLDAYLRSADVRSLDAHCLDSLGETPPFVDANGAGP